MIDAVVKALAQILSPPMRAILWRSIALALVLIVAVATGLQRLLSWLAASGGEWAEGTLGASYHLPIEIASWIVSIAAGLGIVVGAIFLMPAITALVAGVFVDDVAEVVEREHYPAETPGTALPFWTGLVQGGKTAALSLVVYLIALPLLLFGGLGVLVFFFTNAWLLGREYFQLAAMRFRSIEDAREMRRRNAGIVFLAGLAIAAFVSIPIVNLATPLFGMALMVHMHKRLSGPRAELIAPGSGHGGAVAGAGD
ncbi:MAG: sulfate transporter family protein [Proteobacteria bacterium]|nr:MAG: sulfate transporter family protein [Pseudomonadota bacterium]